MNEEDAKKLFMNAFQRVEQEERQRETAKHALEADDELNGLQSAF